MKHTLSKLAVGLVAVLAFAGQANALGTPLAFSPISAGNYSVAGNVLDAASTGNFTDQFSFTLLSTQNVNLSASSIASFPDTFALGGIVPLNASNVSISIQNVILPPPPTLSSSATINTTLTKGTYNLFVSGSNIDGATGNVGFKLSGSVSPVPEPTEGALLLSGIGLLGFIAARRKNVA
jgi:hypothetical protein